MRYGKMIAWVSVLVVGLVVDLIWAAPPVPTQPPDAAGQLTLQPGQRAIVTVGSADSADWLPSGYCSIRPTGSDRMIVMYAPAQSGATGYTGPSMADLTNHERMAQAQIVYARQGLEFQEKVVAAEIVPDFTRQTAVWAAYQLQAALAGFKP